MKSPNYQRSIYKAQRTAHIWWAARSVRIYRCLAIPNEYAWMAAHFCYLTLLISLRGCLQSYSLKIAIMRRNLLSLIVIFLFSFAIGTTTAQTTKNQQSFVTSSMAKKISYSCQYNERMQWFFANDAHHSPRIHTRLPIL